MPQIVIENFYRGLLKDYPLKGSEALQNKRGDIRFALAQTRINPFPNPGYIQPCFTGVDIDSGDASVITTEITSFAIKNGRSSVDSFAAYGIGATILYKITGATYVDVTNNTPSTPTWPHTISGAVSVSGDIHDCVTSNQNIGGTPVYCLFYSANTNASTGTGVLGRFDIQNNSNWTAGNSADNAFALTQNDVPDTGGNFSVPRPITVGTNKILYVGSGYKIDSLDLAASSSSIVNNALDIDRSFEIQSLAFYKGSLVIAAHLKSASAGTRGKVAVFFWDTFATTFSDPIYIEEDFCGALYSDDINLYLFTANATYGNLRIWDGQGFTSIQQISSAIPAHGGVDTFRNGLVWGDSSGKAWFYGEIKEGEGTWLWQFFQDGSSLSCVKKLNPSGDILHFAGTNSGTEFIHIQNTTYQGGTYSFPVIDLPNRSTIKRVEAHFLTLATGASATVRYLLNGSNSYTNHGTITFADDGAVARKVFNNRITNVSSIAFDFTMNGLAANEVVLERLIIDYMVPATKQSS